MTFLWPPMLLALLAVPLVVGVYLSLERRRRAAASGFYRLGGPQATARRGPGLRRHLPPLLFLLGLAVILVALARPQARISLPRIEGTVVLVFDVSASMGATDVAPSRLEAAKAAAREFVAGRPKMVKIGIVSFSGSGFTVQTPTNDQNALLSTIARLKPTSGTSLGQGIVTALYTIAEDAGLVKDEAAAGSATPGQGTPAQRNTLERLLAQLPEGDYPSSVIVLLSDGENNESVDPLAAAQAAAEHKVRIDALGFGTTAGATLKVDGYTVHTAMDEVALQQITAEAGGAYYSTQGEQDRKQVYANLTPQLVVKTEQMEVTSILAGASIVLLLAGSLVSLLWFNRLP